MSVNHKGIAHELAEFHNKDTGLCCPSLETLAKNLCCDVRSVRRYLTSLEEAGIISRQERFIEGRQTTTNYIFRIPNLSPRPDKAVPPGEDRSVPHNQEVDNRVVASSGPIPVSAPTQRRRVTKPVAGPDVPSGVDEVREYINAHHGKGLVYADEFIAHYEAAIPPWTRNGKPVRSWRQTVLTWIRVAKDRQAQRNPAQKEIWQ
jgi:hypothetical protein